MAIPGSHEPGSGRGTDRPRPAFSIRKERKVPLQWFRLYSKFSNDPDVQMMSEAMQRRLVMILCMRNNETLQERCIAFHLRISDAELAETKALFIQKGWIDSDWNVLNWDRLQYVSDSSTERVSRFRAKKKQAETLLKRDETKNETVPEQNRTDSEHKKLSRDKREADPRHSLFKDMFFGYVKDKVGVEPEWNGHQAKKLSDYLRGSPALNEQHWKRILQNRARSEVAHGEELSKWIGRAKEFYQGPLDRFGKPTQTAQAVQPKFLNGASDAR